MSIRLAIHGFGRIGRLILRAFAESGRDDVQIVAIKDWGTGQSALNLLRYDSVHGRLPFSVEFCEQGAYQGFNFLDHKIYWFGADSPTPPSKLWSHLEVDIVLECSGRLTTKTRASYHLEEGARQVLISAPTQDADFTVVYGINHENLKPFHKVVSNASCTTNCLAPLAKVLHDNFVITKGYMTTVHAYTGDQNLVDKHHTDPCRARACNLSMIPTKTGAAKTIGLILPELNGKLDGSAIRVPISNVSLVDLQVLTAKTTTPNDIEHAMLEASSHNLKEILEINKIPLVSCDFNHQLASCIFDSTQTQVVEGNLCRVLAWYDNEWAFSNRMLDVASYMGHLGLTR